MCRRFQMYAFSLIAFGAGVLMGGSLEGGLTVICIGIGGIMLGLYLLQKK